MRLLFALVILVICHLSIAQKNTYLITTRNAFFTNEDGESTSKSVSLRWYTDGETRLFAKNFDGNIVHDYDLVSFTKKEKDLITFKIRDEDDISIILRYKRDEVMVINKSKGWTLLYDSY